jgi:hypothetical protein
MIEPRISKVSRAKWNWYHMLMVHSITASSFNMWAAIGYWSERSLDHVCIVRELYGDTLNVRCCLVDMKYKMETGYYSVSRMESRTSRGGPELFWNIIVYDDLLAIIKDNMPTPNSVTPCVTMLHEIPLFVHCLITTTLLYQIWLIITVQ